MERYTVSLCLPKWYCASTAVLNTGKASKIASGCQFDASRMLNFQWAGHSEQLVIVELTNLR